MIITYNIELRFSNNTETQQWISIITEARDVFNDCVQRIIDTKCPLSLQRVHNECYDYLRKKHPLLPAQTIIKIYKDVISAFRSIKSNKHKNAEAPFKKGFSMRLDKRLYKNLSIDGVMLSGLEKRKLCKATFILYDKVRSLFATCKTQDPLIFYKDNRFFLSVPFEQSELPLQNTNAMGIDMGVKRFITTSDGNAYVDKQYADKKRKLRYLKDKLKSKKTRSAKRHLMKLKRKEHNMSKNQVYKMANAVIRNTNASIIAMEDLTKIKQNTSKTAEGYKRKKHNNRLGQVPFYMFKEVLTHKAALVGKQVVTVSPTWTSQMDCRTNKRDGKRLGCRYYCSDGIVFDADWNAAINIAQRSNHPVSICLPLDGKLNILTGRALSTAQSSKIV